MPSATLATALMEGLLSRSVNRSRRARVDGLAPESVAVRWAMDRFQKWYMPISIGSEWSSFQFQRQVKIPVLIDHDRTSTYRRPRSPGPNRARVCAERSRALHQRMGREAAF